MGDYKFLLFFMLVVAIVGALFGVAEGAITGHGAAGLFAFFTGGAQASTTSESGSEFAFLPIGGGTLQNIYNVFTWNYAVLNANSLGGILRWLVLFPITLVMFLMLVFATLAHIPFIGRGSS